MDGVQRLLLSIHPAWLMLLDLFLVVRFAWSVLTTCCRRRQRAIPTADGSTCARSTDTGVASTEAGTQQGKRQTIATEASCLQPHDGDGHTPAAITKGTPDPALTEPGALTIELLISVGGARAPGRARHFGTKTGTAYAADFAAKFITWARREGLYRAWSVHQILHMAAYEFAREAGLEMPVDRNFLHALKGRPEFIVMADRRVYDAQDHYINKTTFYELRSNVSLR